MNWTQKFSVPRRTFLGGSDAVMLMKGERQRLWRLKKGLDEDADLSGVLPVVMGLYTEELNRLWFAKKTQLTVERPRRNDDGTPTIYRHPAADIIACHPDGFVDTPKGRLLFEAKHIGADYSMDDAIDRYYWQLVHNSMVCGCDYAFLSVFFGNGGWSHELIPIRPDQARRLLTAELEFWDTLEAEQPPEDLSKSIRSLEIQAMQEVDMSGNNLWASTAADFLDAQPRARTFDKAKDTLKGLLPANAKRAYAAGVEVVRNRGGAILVREMRDAAA